MPTYEYQCRQCGKKFEEFQSITDAPLTRCHYCKGPVDRLISGGSGMLFKGSGFYTTDYRSESYKKAARKDKSAESKKPSPDSGPGTPERKGKPGVSSTD